MSNPTGIERAVCNDIAKRQEMGTKKYGVTVADNPLTRKRWLQHLYEELLDAAIYAKKNIAEEDEKVLCIPRGHLESLSPEPIHGLTVEVERFFPSIVKLGNFQFMARCLAEGDPAFKQVIPYILVITEHGNVFRYKRSKKGDEHRLHDLFSIGVGGHINDGDFNGELTYGNAVRRELSEEIGWELAPFATLPAIGIVNHDDTEVAKVHVGVIHVLKITDGSAGSVLKFCDHLDSPEFIPIADLTAENSAVQYEGWSQFCIDDFDKILKKAKLI